jgi:hypothetical protein
MSAGDYLVLFMSGLIGIGAIAGLVTYLHRYPGGWRETLKTYQELIGGTVALVGAIIALIGILMTIHADHDRTQEQIHADHDRTQEQIDAQSILQEQAEERRRGQISSAFAGDISSVIAEINSDLVWKQLSETIDALKVPAANQYSVKLKFLAKLSDLYQNQAAEIGRFEEPVPEWIASFYNTYRNVIAHNDILTEKLEVVSRPPPELSEIAEEEVNLIKRTILLGCASREMLKALSKEIESDAGKNASQTSPKSAAEVSRIATKNTKIVSDIARKFEARGADISPMPKMPSILPNGPADCGTFGVPHN